MMASVLNDTSTIGKSGPLPRWAWFIVVPVVAIILWFTFKDLNEPLLDRHSHRQTQTAISVDYMLREGAWFPYITPVLGAPWSIPMEFPLYQWIVAAVVKVSGMPLELTGRLVSLLFWWLVLFELFRGLRYFIPSVTQRALVLLLIAASPASIYWSRSFLIETCALYLSVAFGRQVLRAILEQKKAAWGWAACFGILAALQKITTLFVVEVLVGMILIVWLIQARQDSTGRKKAVTNLLSFLALAVVTLVTALAWTAWSDGVKEQNALARDMITSKALQEWNYGTVNQRLSATTWQHFLSNVTLGFTGRTPGLGYKVPLLLWGLMIVLVRRRLLQQGVVLLAFMAGPLVFMNLYHIHEYYFVANGYLLLLAIGLAGVAAAEDSRKWIRRGACVFFALLIASELFAYPRYHWLLFAEVPDRQTVERDFRAMLDSRMAAEETLLVYGRDWDPSVAFYGGHKAIIDPFTRPLADPHIEESLKRLSPEERVGAMIVNGSWRTNAVFLQERIKAFDLEAEPQHASYWGDIYFRRK